MLSAHATQAWAKKIQPNSLLELWVSEAASSWKCGFLWGPPPPPTIIGLAISKFVSYYWVNNSTYCFIICPFWVTAAYQKKPKISHYLKLLEIDRLIFILHTRQLRFNKKLNMKIRRRKYINLYNFNYLEETGFKALAIPFMAPYPFELKPKHPSKPCL